MKAENFKMVKPVKAVAPKAAAQAPAYITADEVPEDTLKMIRDQMRIARDQEQRVADLESVLATEKKALSDMKMIALPELFTKAGIDNLGLPAEGNNPSYDFELRSYTHASIGADWDEDRRAEAFKFLEQKQVGGADIIKTEIVIYIPREQRAVVKKVMAALKPFKGLDLEQHDSVAWNTLTAFVKEAIEKRGLILPLEKLGATRGMIVNFKERKDGTTQKEGTTPRNRTAGTTGSPEGTGRKKAAR